MFNHVGARLKKSYKREPYMTHEEWAKNHVYFSGTSVSPIPGQFQIKYSPHYRKLFQLMDRPSVRALYAKWASQSGKSLFEVIIVGKKLDTDPANVTLALPIEDDVKKIVERKLDPVLKGMKRLWSKFEDYRVDESVRASRALKQLAGGSLLISGSGVKARKSESLPLLVMDEIGEFERGAVEEFTERLKAFSKSFPREVGVSTIVDPQDEICTNYDAMEAKMKWEYVCPSCKDHFYPGRETFSYMTKEEYCAINDVDILEIKMDKYKQAARLTGRVTCPHCDHEIDTNEKDRMILNDELDWFFYEGDENSNTIGADMNSLGSYFVPFELLVEKMIAAEGDDTKLDKLYRGWFNKFYNATQKTTEKNDILLLSNGVAEWEIPEDTIPHGVVMGVDSQKNHYWYEIKAYQYGMKSNTISAGRVETLNEIERLFEKTYYDKDGNEFYIERMGIDRQGYVKKETVKDEDGNDIVVETENNIDLVDEWCMNMVEKWGEDRIYPTIGADKITGDLMYKFSTIDKDFAKTRVPIPLKALKISNLRAKNTLNQSIQNTIKKVKGESEVDQRLFYINQTIVDEINLKEKSVSTDYHRQYTSEVFTYGKTPSGKLKTEKSWVKQYSDNHLWDTGATCTVLAHLLRLEAEVKPEKTEDNSFLSSFDKLM